MCDIAALETPPSLSVVSTPTSFDTQLTTFVASCKRAREADSQSPEEDPRTPPRANKGEWALKILDFPWGAVPVVLVGAHSFHASPIDHIASLLHELCCFVALLLAVGRCTFAGS